MPLAISMASSKLSTLDEADHGAEDFFLRDAHAGLDAGEDGGRKEVCLCA